MSATTAHPSIAVPALLLALASAIASAIAPRPASACASCACGDPTLTALGVELPFEGRLRLALHASVRSENAGIPGVDEVAGGEQRLTLAAAWSPISALTIGVAVPMVRKTAVEVSARTHSGYGLADVELRARLVAIDRRVKSSRHLFSLHGGADVPLMPALEGLPIEAQPSSGAFSGLAGASYAMHARPWTLYASITGRLSTPGHLEVVPGPVALATLAAQAQIHSAWALGVSVDGRLDGPAQHDGADDPHSGGILAVVSPQILFSPATDWLITAKLGVPLSEGLRGEHREGVSATMGVTCDL